MIALDAMAFPLVAFPPLGLEVMLLPVTRTQFDFFLGDRTGVNPATLQEIERLAPRKSWRAVSTNQLETQFIAAIHAAEAEAFARWYGHGFRLPTELEWRAVDRAISALGERLESLRTALNVRRFHPAATSILTMILTRTPASWRSATLFENGLMEWVRRPSGYGLQGRPRTDVLRVVHNPQIHEAIVPRTAERHPAFGFRLVRSLAVRVQR